jgi:uncharacterized membrane protein YdjX (TVP38/TMEM64 family)
VGSQRKFPTKLVFAGLALLALFAAGRLLPLADWLRASETWVKDHGALGMALFFFAYVAVTLLMGPAWLLTIAAGLTWGLAIGVPLVWVSATAGAAAAFLLGRTLARDRVKAVAKKNETLGALDRAVEKKGWKIVFLLRLSPVVPFVFSNYVYGLTAIRFWPYVAASAFGMLPLTALYVAAGAAGQAALGGGPPRGPWTIVALAAGALLTIGVTVYVTRIAKRELAQARGAKA